MSADTTQLEAKSPPNTPPKAGGPKVRLKCLDDLDRRTHAAQAAFKLRDDLASDLGGWDRLSVQERLTVQMAAFWSAVLEDQFTSYIAGAPVDLIECMTLTNGARRLLEGLGLARRPRDISPGVDAYLRERST